MTTEKPSSSVVQEREEIAAERRGTAGVALRQKRSNFRWVLAIFAMLMTFMSYLDRVNLSVTAPAIMKELHFTKVHIGTLQTVFFLCYALFQIPSGTLTEYFGHRKIVPLALAWWSVFTSLTAFCSRFSSWVVIRGLFGMGEAPIYPGLNAAFSNWFPKRERGTAVGLMLLGSKFGPMVGIPCATVIMLYWGWRAVFVVFGAVGLVIALIYYLMLRTYPHESRFVNEAELEHIADGQVASDTAKLMPPWKDLFRSSQFWAVGGQFAMVDYIQYVFIAWLPVYLLEAHHFSLKQMGFAAALPELGFAVGNLLCGVISDRLIAKKIVGSKARAWFGAAGLLLCCLALYLTAVSEARWMTVIWLSFALFFLGFPMNSSWTTCTDISAGKFTGTITGWMNFCGNIIGGAAPMVTAWIATQYGWRAAILATASAGIIGAIFWLFVKPDVPLKHRYSEAVVAARA
jgi:ACS family glucarate transporter-like MFS transporter